MITHKLKAQEVADGIMLDVFGIGWDNTPRHYQARNRILVALTNYGDPTPEIERLRAALLPFARLARYLVGRPDGNPLTDDVAVMHIHAAPGNTVVNVGHVRAARDALASTEKEDVAGKPVAPAVA